MKKIFPLVFLLLLSISNPLNAEEARVHKVYFWNVISIFNSLFSFLPSSFSSNQSYVSLRGFGSKTPELPALYGAFYDDTYKINSSSVRKPKYIGGGRLELGKYFGSMRMSLSSELGYNGEYLSQFGIDHPEDRNYLLGDSISDLTFTYYFAENLYIFLGPRYRFLISKGNYSDEFHNSSDNQYKRFYFFQNGLGYRAGFGFGIHPLNIPDALIQVVPSITYYPNNTEVFKVYGIESERNEARFDLYCGEVLSSLVLGKSQKLQLGVVSRYYYQTSASTAVSNEKIHKNKEFGYYEISPFVEVSTTL